MDASQVEINSLYALKSGVTAVFIPRVIGKGIRGNTVFQCEVLAHSLPGFSPDDLYELDPSDREGNIEPLLRKELPLYLGLHVSPAFEDMLKGTDKHSLKMKGSA